MKKSLFAPRSEIEIKAVANPNNILITENDICDILGNYGIEDVAPEDIKRLPQWQKAFAHPSYCEGGGSKKLYQQYMDENEVFPDDVVPLQKGSSERLEWVGDKVIDSCISMYLYKRYRRQDEGFLTKIRSKIVRKESLANLAKKIGLDRYLLISAYLEEEFRGRDNNSNLEDCFEAFIGAMWLEFGMERFDLYYRFLSGVIERHVDFTKFIMVNNNHKDTLMRFYQKNYQGAIPKYGVQMDPETRRPAGPPFIAWVFDPTGKRKIATSEGSKKKDAEQNAAKQALIHYKVNIRNLSPSGKV